MKIRLLVCLAAAWLALPVASSLADSPSFTEARKADDQGHATAQTNLGVSYAKGQGVAQDRGQAYMWFSLAVAQDEEGARKELGLLESLMTPTQREEAQRMARERKPATASQPPL